MRTILIAVDGPAGGAIAARHAAAEMPAATVHLLSVQPHVRAYAGRFLGGGRVRAYQRDAGNAALAPARRILDEAGLGYVAHIHVGDEGRITAGLARSVGADAIVMGDGARAWFDRLLFRILAARVIRRAGVPVLVVKERQPMPQAAASRWRPAFSR